MGECAGCGTTNRSEARFCVRCGASLLDACPSCGSAADPSDAFCARCGAPLRPSEAAEAAPGSAPSGRERRRVSVLFCDLVGYTTLADGRDPEETRELLSGYFDLARAVIGRYGGAVEKFIGDAVMAVWGAPTAHEDDAERAVRAGLELLDAVAGYGQRRGQDLRARVGVASGSAATVEDVTEGLVVGDRVNLAARVQSAATPGTCFVDEPTRRLAGGAIAFEDAGEHTLKGVAEPVHLHRAARVVSWVGGQQRSSGLEAPLVGRDAELRAVKELFHASAERRVPRLVVVGGPAGVGKSRIGWELEKYIDGLVEAVLWHRGRCLSYGDGVTFWALAEMVRQRLSIAEEDPSEVAAAKLAEGLVRLVPEQERDYVGARLARLLGVESPAARAVTLTRDELFAGWRLFFERLAAVSPVVLLVEDAQHADTGLLEFLGHLVDWARQLPIFVVVLARSELVEDHPAFGVGRNRTTLSLDPLDEPAMDQLVGALLPGLPDRGRHAVTARAQGIPLFAVETVRSLIDAGQVAADPADGSYRLVGELTTLDVPDSLQALLAARLDVLDPGTRRLVGVASVLGTTFPAEALISVSGADSEGVRAALDELVRRDVLEVTADPLSPQRGDYCFTQELLRQVAYDTLPRQERRSRHLAVATHLRATFPNDGAEIADVIARHYLDALAAAPDQGDDRAVAAEADAMLERAGARAEASGVPGRAAASYARAAELSAAATAGPGGDPERLERAAQLWERAARAATRAFDTEAAVAHARSAEECYERTGDRRGAARLRAVAGRATTAAGRHADARALILEALAVLEREPDADTVEALSTLAGIELFDGNVDEGFRVSAKALETGQAVEVDDRLLAQLFTYRGIAHSIRGNVAQAIAYDREAARIAERAGDSEMLGTALVNLSDELSSVDPVEGAEAARSAAEHGRRVGAERLLGVAVANLAAALFELGRWDEAAEALEVVAADEHVHHDVLTAQRGLLTALRGEVEGARAILGRLGGAAGSEDVQTQAMVSMVRAYVAELEGDEGAALAAAREAITHVDALGVRHEVIRWAWPLAARLADPPAVGEMIDDLRRRPSGHIPPTLRAEAALARARLSAAGGEPGAAEQIGAAVAALRWLDSPYRLAGGLLDQAEHLAGDGDAAAAAAIEEAEAIAESLGCRPLLDRAARLVDRLPIGG